MLSKNDYPGHAKKTVPRCFDYIYFITYMRKTSVINCLSLQILKGEIISYYKEISWQIVSSKVTHKTPTKQ